MTFQEREPIEVEVAELKPRMKSISILFKIVEIGEPRDVTSRRDGEQHRVADAIVGDTSGIVVMPLWDQSIEEMEAGKTYKLTNGYTTLYQGFLRLNIGKYGEISASEEDIAEINMENDMSEEKHEREYRPRRDRGDRRY